MYRNVVVAYDGSEVARIALARAAGIARSDGASLTLVEAVAGKVPSPAPGGPPLAKPEKRAMAREDLNRAIEQLDPEAGGQRLGDRRVPAKGILTVADDIGADLIGVGSPEATRIVLGAGFGGLELTTILSEELDDDAHAVLIDQGDAFVFGSRGST